MVQHLMAGCAAGRLGRRRCPKPAGLGRVEMVKLGGHMESPGFGGAIRITRKTHAPVENDCRCRAD
jgi:hypothetical protein